MDKMARKRALEKLGFIFVSGWVRASKAKILSEKIKAENDLAEKELSKWNHSSTDN